MSTGNDFVELTKALRGLEDDITTKTKEVLRVRAKDLSKAIQRESPVRKSGTSKSAKGKELPRGTYAKGWTNQKTVETAYSVRYKIYNRGQQQPLVHLLQFGHNLPQGGKARAIDHVFKERDKIEKQIEQDIEEAINHADFSNH